MITPGYSPTATERVLPRMALDFTTASLDSRVTVTRALNTATRTNSSGLVEIVNADLPRFDYDPVTLVCKGLLIEESRINRVQYSEDFNSWTKTEVTVTTNAVTAPDGTSTADKLIANTANATHLVSQTGLSSSVSVLSFYAKAAEETVISGWLGGAAVGASFNLTTGVATSQGATSFGMYPVGNGWYRCWVYWTTATTTAHIYMRTGGGFTGNGTSGLYLWGAQLEAGAFLTSYIPNTGTSTATRNADAVSMTGTNFSSWYNATEGTFLVEADTINATANQTKSVLIVSNGTFADTIYTYISATAALSLLVRSGNATEVNSAYPVAITSNTFFKYIAAYKANNFASTFNSQSPSLVTSGNLPVGANELTIGCATVGGGPINGRVKSVLYWPQRVTDAETRAFSKQ